MSLTIETKNLIADEVAAQLDQLRQQLHIALCEDIKILVKSEIERVLTSKNFDKKIKAEVSKVSKLSKESCQEPNNLQLSLNNEQIISELKQYNNQAMVTIANNMQKNIYGKVMDSVNEQIIPKMNHMAECISYTMQDGGEVVDNYRRAFESEANKHNVGMRMLTNTEKQDKRIIGDYVRTFFDNESDSDD